MISFHSFSVENMDVFFDHLSEVFWVRSLDLGQLLYVSRGCETHFSLSREKLCRDPMSWYDNISPCDYSLTLSAINDFIEKKDWNSTLEITYRIIHPDSHVCCHIKDRLFFIQFDGCKTRYLASVTNNDDNATHRQVLQDENKLLKRDVADLKARMQAIEQSVIGDFWQKDVDGVYQIAHIANLDEWGYESGADLLGKQDSHLNWASSAQSRVDYDSEVLRRQVTIQREEHIQSNHEGRTIDRHYVVRKSPLFDGSGQLTGTIGQAIDVSRYHRLLTELATGQGRLEEEKERFSAFMASVIGYHWLKDVDGVYIGCSNDFARLYGLASSDIVGCRDEELPWADQAEGSKEMDQVAMGALSVTTQYFSRKLDDGLLHHFLVSKVPMLNSSGEPVAIIGSAVDVTNEKHCQQQLSKLEKQCTLMQQEYQVAQSELNQCLRTTFTSATAMIQDLKKNCAEDPSLVALEALLHETTSTIDQLMGIEHKECQSVSDCHAPEVEHLTLVAEQSGNMRVLLVEDNELNLRVMTSMLYDLSCDVFIATDGSMAIEMAKQADYDMIFMDIGLPVMDGISVTKYLRSQPQCQQVPIVGVTAHVMDEDVRRCYDAQMNYVLCKPVSINDFQMVINRFYFNALVG